MHGWKQPLLKLGHRWPGGMEQWQQCHLGWRWHRDVPVQLPVLRPHLLLLACPNTWVRLCRLCQGFISFQVLGALGEGPSPAASWFPSCFPHPRARPGAGPTRSTGATSRARPVRGMAALPAPTRIPHLLGFPWEMGARSPPWGVEEKGGQGVPPALWFWARLAPTAPGHSVTAAW